MATRAEIAKARAQRTGRVKPSKRKKLEAARLEEPEVIGERIEREVERSVSGRSAGGVTARRNVKLDLGKHESYDLDDSAGGRPSRKSTRKAAHRRKPDASLRRKASSADQSPKRRASKSEARVKRARGRAAPGRSRAS